MSFKKKKKIQQLSVMSAESCQPLKQLVFFVVFFKCTEPPVDDGFSDQRPSFTDALRSVTTVWLQGSGFWLINKMHTIALQSLAVKFTQSSTNHGGLAVQL